MRNAQNVLDISIHAPTRGATIKSDLYIGKVRISIHAPTRGATSASKSSLISTIISIHAPTRGATRLKFTFFNYPLFQSTLLQEERPESLTFYHRIIKFQSTLLQEERQQKCTIILILICNNYCIVSIKSHQHYNNYFM